MIGEIFVGADGTLGLRMAQGQLRVHEAGGTQRTVLAGLDPMFLPRRPEVRGPLFTTDEGAAPLAGAKAAFTPRGESLGYLRADGQLVVHPGYTADLTRPFAAKLVQLAKAQIPERDREGALPVFDVHGHYVGYLAGPAFYSHTQTREVPTQASGASVGIAAAGVVGAGVLAVVGGGSMAGVTNSAQFASHTQGPPFPVPPEPPGPPVASPFCPHNENRC